MTTQWISCLCGTVAVVTQTSINISLVIYIHFHSAFPIMKTGEVTMLDLAKITIRTVICSTQQTDVKSNKNSRSSQSTVWQPEYIYTS